jgi:amino acid transporter
LVVTNIRGVRGSARVIEGITIAKILPLLGFVAIGLFFVTLEHFAWTDRPTTTQVMATAGIVIFAFSGIESALAPSGEVKNPSRTVPLASFIALGAATLLYLLIQGVALGIEGLALANDKVTPLATAAQSFAGPVGKIIMIAGATISMLGYLSANVLVGPRSWYALARDGFLFRQLSVVHPRFHTPHIAIVAYGIVIALLALTGTFEQLAILSNVTSFVLYALCAIAVWVLRKRDVRSDGAPFLIPGGPIVPIATCIANIWLLYATAGRGDWLGLGLALAISVLLFGVRWWRRSRVA